MLNIISVDQLTNEGYEFLIKSDMFNIIINGFNIMSGQMKNDIYMLSWPIYVMNTSYKFSRLDKVSDTFL